MKHEYEIKFFGKSKIGCILCFSDAEDPGVCPFVTVVTIREIFRNNSKYFIIEIKIDMTS